MRACWRCGSGRLAADWDGELRCLSCGRTPPVDQNPDAVARLTGLSPRTIARWIDAGLVAASSPRGSGRPRLVDTGGVIRLLAERHTLSAAASGAGGRSRRRVSSGPAELPADGAAGAARAHTPTRCAGRVRLVEPAPTRAGGTPTGQGLDDVGWC